jgi:hypothetical protein
MTKDQIGPVPSFYQGYVQKVGEPGLLMALHFSLKKLEMLDISLWGKLHQQSYFPGKWTLNEVIQHILDTERIMSYRALCFARGEVQSLPGYDENAYAALSDANERTIPDLYKEWLALRKSSIYLFESFSNQSMMRSGIANGNSLSVGALGFIIVGHELHHINVIQQLYLPLL